MCYLLSVKITDIDLFPMICIWYGPHWASAIDHIPPSIKTFAPVTLLLRLRQSTLTYRNVA
jgi:hypothetical protein